MDKQYIEDNEIGIKYLRNQLTPEEVEEFEVYLMDNPDVVDELKIDRIFLDSFDIKVPTVTSQLDEKLTMAPNNRGQSQFSIQRSGRTAILTAVSLISLSLLLVLSFNRNVVEVELYNLRSSSVLDQAVKLPKFENGETWYSSDYYELSFYTPNLVSQKYSVNIIGLSGMGNKNTNIWKFSDLDSSVSGRLSIKISARDLVAGKYLLKSVGRQNDETTEIYFEVSD